MGGSSSKPLVGILLFDEVEVLDFAGPYEVFACAKDQEGGLLFDVLTLGAGPGATCTGGLVIKPDALMAQSPDLDILVVPGGAGARQGDLRTRMINFIQYQHKKGALITSVCTGAYLVAEAGLLEGKIATTHTRWLEDFASKYPNTRVVRQKVVDQLEAITAGGVASGIDLALYLIEKQYGPEERRREAARLDGPWF